MNRWGKLRILTIALIFSTALNIGLLLALVFSSFEEPGESLVVTKWGAHSEPAPTNCELLNEMLKLSFSELIACLTNHDLVEEGYTKRDLALSALVAAHDFYLDKALSSPLQKRFVSLSEDRTIEMYPGLTDEQYEAIIRYAYQEKWPLTPKGLFRMLSKCPKNARDPSLCEAFFATPEFYALQVLFQKTEAPQDSSLLLNLIVEGPWDVLERFTQEQAKGLDLSVEKRRSLLFTYLSLRSPSAADLLLRTDFLFVKTRLVDGGVLLLLELLQERSPYAEHFCVELLHSPRTDAVWRAAAKKLYVFVGEKEPEPFDFQIVLSRFAPSAKASTVSLVKAEGGSVRVREHVVQEGENLWKIARKYKVKIEDLMEHNVLEKDRLLPGMVLQIPQGTGSEPPR